MTAETLADLAVIPVIFIIQTLVSYLVSIGVSKAFGFSKRPSNFVTAMGVFGNSNSLPISLVISLSQTLKGLHWDRIPGDNDDEVSARGILYLLIFQQLGQLVRWSWGYHVLLAPPEDSGAQEADAVEEGRYANDGESDMLIEGLHPEYNGQDGKYKNRDIHGSQSSASFESGGVTPFNADEDDEEDDNDENGDSANKPLLFAHNRRRNEARFSAEQPDNSFTSFPIVRSSSEREEANVPVGVRGYVPSAKRQLKRGKSFVSSRVGSAFKTAFNRLPSPVRTGLSAVYAGAARFLHGLWEFMNPPLWAMLIAIIVASVPSLQRAFFAEGTFVSSSVTRAVGQSGSVAVPLILVVLGANLARNTLPSAAHDENNEENKIGTKLLVASLVSRMVLPTLIMAPILAFFAKYVPVSIVDDPIFVIVCFLLTGAPSALQLAQICQINGVYEGVMSKILFQSYVIWYVTQRKSNETYANYRRILPSTLVLVMCALEVVEWAKPLSA